MGLTYHRNSGTPRKISQVPSITARRPDQAMLPNRNLPVLRPIQVERPPEHPRTEGSLHLLDRARVWPSHPVCGPPCCMLGPVRGPDRDALRRCGPARPPRSPGSLRTSRSPCHQRSPRWCSPAWQGHQTLSATGPPRVGVRGGGRPGPACSRPVPDQGCRGAARWSGRER